MQIALRNKRYLRPNLGHQEALPWRHRKNLLCRKSGPKAPYTFASLCWAVTYIDSSLQVEPDDCEHRIMGLQRQMSLDCCVRPVRKINLLHAVFSGAATTFLPTRRNCPVIVRGERDFLDLRLLASISEPGIGEHLTGSGSVNCSIRAGKGIGATHPHLESDPQSDGESSKSNLPN